MDYNFLGETGVSRYGVISTDEISFYPEIRDICRGNVCRQYGKTWACPPGVGTLEECKEKCMRFSRAIVFSNDYKLKDSFDVDGMSAGHSAFKDLCDRLYDAVKNTLCDFLLLSNEGCMRCISCTYPKAPCRMPEKLFPSIEGFGINVSELAEKAGIQYHGGGGTVSYFGVLLYNDPEEIYTAHGINS